MSELTPFLCKVFQHSSALEQMLSMIMICMYMMYEYDVITYFQQHGSISIHILHADQVPFQNYPQKHSFETE